MPGTTDTVKAILTPGEFVIRKEAVDMIGAPMLNMINNMPEKGGHSNIDSLIEKATMANMKGMYGGGMVQAGPKPMGTGGMVDAYAGGGMVMDQYGHGGKVKKNLKPVPKDNPGLGKLPEAVRNKMGYMQEGGKVLPAFMKAVDSRDARSVLTQFSEFPEMAVQGIYEMNEPSGRGKRYYFGKGQVPSARVSDLEKASAMALINAIQSQQESPQDSIPLSSVLQMLRDPEVKGDKQSIDGMQEGGEVESRTLKDILDPYLPRKDDILPYLEFVTGASAETEDYQPGALDAALSIPLVGGVGSGIKRLIKSAGQKKALKNIAKQEDLARYTFPDYSGESLDMSK